MRHVPIPPGLCGAALAAGLALCPAPPVAAHSLLITLWPSRDPGEVLRCALHMEGGRMRMVQARGQGAGEPMMAWAPDAAEEAVMMAALAAFVSGDLPSIPPTDPGQPPPPYLTVSWITRLDGEVAAGRMVAPGLALPPMLESLVTQVIPGSLCDPQKVSGRSGG